MTTTATTTASSETPDVSDLARAIEASDADTVAAWYADDATITIVDRNHPPSTPLVVQGIDQVRTYFRDVCGRDLQHEVRDLIASPTQLAFAQHCRYPDGLQVLCITTAALADGRITDQTIVQAWDA